MNFKNYFRELKRRNVFKAALAYLVVAWVIVQVGAIVLPLFKVSPGVLRTIVFVLVFGFPVWLIFAWIYEVTPEGLKKTESITPEESISGQTSDKMNKLILGSLGIAIFLLCIKLFTGFASEAQMDQEPEMVSDIQNEEPERDDQEKSIAVLAFEDMSPQQDQEYFADGISEEILNSLAQSPEMAVISRTSSFYFENKEATIEQIGEKLDVNYILEGSVRKAGDQIRVTAQLIDVSTGAHLWSETYDRELKDIFKIQDEIAEKVSSKLETSLLGKSTTEIDPQAYSLYLKARHIFRQDIESSKKRILEILEKAIEIEPDYAPAWALVSETHLRITMYEMSLSSEEKRYHMEKGREAASKAIKIDPEYPFGYFTMAIYKFLQSNYQEAKQYAEKALELNPNNAEILRRIDIYTFPTTEQAIKNVKRSLRLDPLMYKTYYDLAYLLYNAGRNEEALEAMKKYESYFPNASSHFFLKSQILLNLERYDKALEVINKDPDEFWRSYAMVEYLYKVGKVDQALKKLDAFIKKYPTEATNIADIYASIGKKEKTFEWLENAVELEDPTLGAFVYSPSFAKYHSDPRWQQLLEDLELPKENGVSSFRGDIN